MLILSTFRNALQIRGFTSKSYRISGIDEAGRGAVIGPLVVCCFNAAAEEIDHLQALGKTQYLFQF